MSDFMWPPENVTIEVYANISDELISLKDYVKNLNIFKATIPAPAFLLYKDLKLTSNEWQDLINSLKNLSNTELLDIEDRYIKNHPEEFDETSILC